MTAQKVAHDAPLDQTQIVLEPFTYLTSRPGKGIRSKLLNAFNIWFNLPAEALRVVQEVTELLHNASLLIDDIEDNSDIRRGAPASHKVFGIPATINSANYVYFQALDRLHALNNAEAIRIFTEEMLVLHRGQGFEIYFRDSLVCPTQDQYIDMIKSKTGGLFRMAIRIMAAVASDVTIDYIPLVNQLSVHFQIRDDYMNIQSTEYTNTKGYCEDITEGKFSFPVIHSIHSDPNNRQMINILKQRTTDFDLKKHAISLLRDSGSFEYTLDYLHKVEADCRSLIAEHGGNLALETILDYLAKTYPPSLDNRPKAPSS